jgi:hypothetical protein
VNSAIQLRVAELIVGLTLLWTFISISLCKLIQRSIEIDIV